MKSVRVGICGLGTVGSGTVELLKSHAAGIAGESAAPKDRTQICRRRLADVEGKNFAVLHQAFLRNHFARLI